MRSVRTGSLLSRRSLLLSGALLAPLGLAGCSGEWDWLPWASRPRAAVTLSPLTTVSDLVCEDPVFRSEWALSPIGGRPLGLAVRREVSLEADLRIATAADEEPLSVPVDAAASGIIVDGHTDPVRVYTTVVSDGRRHMSMLTSSDLADWTTTDLGTAIERSIVAVGDGLVAAAPYHGAVQIWDVSDDGAIEALSPITVPEEDWKVTALARDAQSVLVAVSRRTQEQDWEPALLSSVDGGVTWSAPEPLPGDGKDPSVREVLVQAGTFIVLGHHRSDVDWDEEHTHRRPAAWSGMPGEDFAIEEIPLPLWGIENFEDSDGRGSLSPDTPIDFGDLDLGLPVLTAEGSEIMAPVYWGDDCRSLRRAEDGTWTVGDVGRYAVHRIVSAVLDDAGRLYRVEEQLMGSRSEAVQDTERLRFAPARELTIAQDAPGRGLCGTFRWSTEFMKRTDEQIRWAERQDQFLIGVEEERIIRDFEPVSGRTDLTGGAVHHLADGLTLFSGDVPHSDVAENPGFSVMARADGGSWEAVKGLPSPENVSWPGTATTVDGVHHLPFTEWIPTDSVSGSVLTPTLFTSADGIEWEEAPAPSIELADEGPGARGGRVAMLTSVDGNVIGIGQLTDEEEGHHPVTFVRDGEDWSVVPLEGAPRGTWLDGVTTAGGRTVVHGRWGSTAAQWALSAEGALERIHLADDSASRGRVIDLGEGALITGGWIDRPAAEDGDDGEEQTGIGACIWASLDGGETWDATMIPGQEGRFPAVTLLEDGENVLVLLDDPDLPRGYRIAQARADVLGAEDG